MFLEILVILIMISGMLWLFGIRWEFLAVIWVSMVRWLLFGLFIGASAYYFNQMMAGGL